MEHLVINIVNAYSTFLLLAVIAFNYISMFMLIRVGNVYVCFVMA